MPGLEQEIIVESNIASVWSCISDLNKIAHCMPGFQQLEIINDTDSLWTVKLDIGMLSRSIRMKASVTQIVKPESVVFSLVGLSEKIEGFGEVRIKDLDTNKTRISVKISLNAMGMTASLVNKMISVALLKQSQDFAFCVKGLLNQSKQSIL